LCSPIAATTTAGLAATAAGRLMRGVGGNARLAIGDEPFPGAGMCGDDQAPKRQAATLERVRDAAQQRHRDQAGQEGGGEGGAGGMLEAGLAVHGSLLGIGIDGCDAAASAAHLPLAAA
jgi:hypothetical protein